MRFGSERHGPVAPVACHPGKYDTRTSTGTPTRLTWKLTWESVERISETVVAGRARESPAGTPLGPLGQFDGPSATICWAHDPGSAYQRCATGSHADCAGPTPVRTSGVLVSGATRGASWTGGDAARKYFTPMSWRCWMPRGTLTGPYTIPVVEGTMASDGDTDSSAWSMKWYGVVVADSNRSPSSESTHPL